MRAHVLSVLSHISFQALKIHTVFIAGVHGREVCSQVFARKPSLTTHTLNLDRVFY
jgi:hypothetical protein